MTCQQLHVLIENHQPDVGLQSAEAARHIALCAACSLFVEQSTRLAENLRLVRKSAPSSPASLDVAILAGYRRHMAEKTGTSLTTLRWQHSFALLSAAAASAALLAAAILLFTSRGVIRKDAHSAPQPSATAHLAQIVVSTTSTAPIIRPTASDRHRSDRPTARTATTLAVNRSRLPDGFRSLMYCDELSCAGAMDIIRVQLPSSAVATPAAGFMPASGSATADVLVGPDGIARGIRIEE